MDTPKAQAEQELKDLMAKYPTLEIFVTTNFAVGFKEKETVGLAAEIVAPETTPEVPVTDTPSVDPMNPQPEPDAPTETV